MQQYLDAALLMFLTSASVMMIVLARFMFDDAAASRRRAELDRRMLEAMKEDARKDKKA